MFSHKRKFLLAVLVFIFSFVVFAQEEEDDNWFWGHTVAEFSFEGLKNVRKSDLAGVVSAYIGEAFTEDLYSDMLDRLYGMDLFSEINVYAKHDKKKRDDILLVISVIEEPVIESINFVGNKQIRNGELRDQISSKASDVYVESKILMEERTLRDYYIKKGYTDSKVSHKIEETASGVKITFVITEGASTVISKINITGNTIVSERTLKSKLSLKETGFLKDGAFQRTTLEADKQKILAYYQERGYIDVEIRDVLIETSVNEEKNRNELTITFIVQEGAQYIYKGVSFAGNEVFPADKLSSYIKLQDGAIYNHVKFQEGLMNIMGLYSENGYMMCDINPVPKKEIDRHEISFNVSVVENTRSHIENIIIKGNTKTKDFVIRRELPIETGDVFSREKIMTGLRNLYNLQYFSNIVPELESGSEQGLVDMVFSVEEQSTTSLQFGLTFSGSGLTNTSGLLAIPFSLYGKLENSNLFGEGRSISTSATLSTTEQSIDFSYGQNWFGTLPIQFSQSLAFSHSAATTLRNNFAPDGSMDTDYHYMNYESWTGSLGTSVGKRWTPDFAILTLAGGITNSLTNNVYDESMYVPVNPSISQSANRWGLLNSVWTSFSMDGRDKNYDPSKGWFMSQRVGWYGFIPKWEKEFFLRSDTKLEGYLTMLNIPFSEKWALKFVLAGYSGLSTIFMPPIPGNFLSDSNKVYVDGMINGRGWTNMYTNSKGKAMWSNKIEIRMPLLENYIGIDGFFDAVAVKSSCADMFTNLSLNDFYFSFGPGIRLLLPQLPLHFLFAFKFRHTEEGFKFEKNPFQFVLSLNMVNK